jgi:hypothetical protein
MPAGPAMRAADDDPLTMVTHARMHQLLARKPLRLVN